ncbi:hypothetical protein [Flagellimonas pacifica]|uniref:Uncharacterized protein n=1 Tax=Flagellimonas pacifica TaxID=1247520 RepID=A0A285MXZ9_9FLAO|nr:hypothetical protein [Allomuricauda parva]SNZ00361.1 hypothetical protein SAMN06265377_2183 [Allomuricauda parva]
MNISFDLDSTLIPNGKEFETEKRHGVAKLLGIEEMRKGTCELISELQNQGNRIHIYTTSFRTKSKIRRTLKYYGIKVDRIVNQTENQRELKARNINSSKFPPAFGFDIHIDDSKGVGIESERHNFKAIIIEPSDENWTEKIKRGIQTTFQFKILKRLFKELWLHSSECKEPIENMWYSIQETAKSNGVSRKEVRKHLNLLMDNNYIKITSEEPLLFEFTEIGKEIKTDLEIEKIIKSVG